MDCPQAVLLLTGTGKVGRMKLVWGACSEAPGGQTEPEAEACGRPAADWAASLCGVGGIAVVVCGAWTPVTLSAQSPTGHRLVPRSTGVSLSWMRMRPSGSANLVSCSFLSCWLLSVAPPSDYLG